MIVKLFFDVPIFYYVSSNPYFWVMDPQFIDKWNTQVKKGLFLFLVLSVIKQKSSFGQEIVRKIKQATGLSISEGTLYPILKKLKEEHLVISKWDFNDENAPRKYYFLTGHGNSTQEEMQKYWSKLNLSVSNFITPKDKVAADVDQSKNITSLI